VLNILLQILDDGRLTDAQGRTVDFRNTIVIMTSNIGADVIKNQSGLGFRRSTDDQTYDNMKKQLMEEIDKHFRPEFLNRLDDVIVFRSLTKEDLRIIVHFEFDLVRARAQEKSVDLRLSPAAAEYLIEKGYSPDYGARPLRRVIEHEIEDPLSEDLLRGVFLGAATVTVSVKDGKLAFDAEAAPTAPKAEQSQAAN
jgi:ATP-dependent Clp protease ATP-binding subunit ClpC